VGWCYMSLFPYSICISHEYGIRNRALNEKNQETTNLFKMVIITSQERPPPWLLSSFFIISRPQHRKTEIECPVYKAIRGTFCEWSNRIWSCDQQKATVPRLESNFFGWTNSTFVFTF
jgi:hypothetical protein